MTVIFVDGGAFLAVVTTVSKIRRTDPRFLRRMDLR